MASALDRVVNGLSKLKSLGETPATLGERDKLVKQLKGDLTFLNNIPPCLDPNPKECVLASMIDSVDSNVYRRGL
jgi:hypothetical protein